MEFANSNSDGNVNSIGMQCVRAYYAYVRANIYRAENVEMINSFVVPLTFI